MIKKENGHGLLLKLNKEIMSGLLLPRERDGG
jgi:hypothetical protein